MLARGHLRVQLRAKKGCKGGSVLMFTWAVYYLCKVQTGQLVFFNGITPSKKRLRAYYHLIDETLFQVQWIPQPKHSVLRVCVCVCVDPQVEPPTCSFLKFCVYVGTLKVL